MTITEQREHPSDTADPQPAVPVLTGMTGMDRRRHLWNIITCTSACTAAVGLACAFAAYATGHPDLGSWAAVGTGTAGTLGSVGLAEEFTYRLRYT